MEPIDILEVAASLRAEAYQDLRSKMWDHIQDKSDESYIEANGACIIANADCRAADALMAELSR